MASKVDNIKSLGKNSRTRVVIFFTASILIGSVLYGYFKLKGTGISGVAAKSKLGSSPTLQSIPGSLNQTPQYSALQNKQNIEQAEKALKTGSSAIPTIVSMQKFDGTQTIGPQSGTGGIGFSTLARLDDTTLKPLWLQDLGDKNCAPDSLKMAVQNGAKIADLKDYCTCGQLKNYGFRLADIQQVCDCRELRLLGYSSVDLKNLGYNAEELRNCGYSACEEKAAGFSAAEMKNAGFADGELKGAGFDQKDVNYAGGLPPGMTAKDIEKNNCRPEYLKQLKDNGVSAAAIRRISGCTSRDLLAADFDAKALKEAGFPPSDLIDLGIDPDDLKKAGFDAKSLLEAGLSPQALRDMGYSDNDLLKAGIAKTTRCTTESIQQAKASGMSVATIHQKYGCDLADLLSSDISPNELLKAGFLPKHLLATGVSVDDLAKAGVPLAELGKLTTEGMARNASRSPDDLAKLISANQSACSSAAIAKEKALGMSANDIHQKFGCDAEGLLKAGFSPADLVKAAFTPGELQKAGLSTADLLKAGMSPADLLGAGFTPQDLLGAGISPKELSAAGVNPGDLLKAGVLPKDLINAGVSPKDLKALGVDAKTLMDAGISPKDLKDVGFTAQELKTAGVDDATLKGLGMGDKIDPFASIASLPTANQTAANALGGPLLAPASQDVQSVDKLNTMLEDQKKMQAQQRFQQKIQQRAASLQSYATQLIAGWKLSPNQSYVAGTPKSKDKDTGAMMAITGTPPNTKLNAAVDLSKAAPAGEIYVKTGDILFAVIDTAVNTDEPGPILATITNGPLRNSKLIGSFNTGANAEKLTMTFNTLSIQGMSKTIGISAYAIDPNTGRTALSSSTDHHYLMRYGALFASTFLEGFGNAFQSADTQITIGGTGGETNTTVQNGINRSLTDNAVIGLATLGKGWGQQAQKNMNVPTTIQVYSGTPIGVLFLQDVTLENQKG